MKSLPAISIVVPSFNQGRYLRQALDSIFDQRYPRLEVVVMDGGSTDGSVEIIQSFAHRLTYWQSQPDQGQAAAINDGMARCSGDVVAWLNSDDFYSPDSLWNVARAYATYRDYGLYTGNGFRLFEDEGKQIPFSPHPIRVNRRLLTHGSAYLMQPATFFSRRAWEAVGGLNPDLHFGMDWDIFIRILRQFPAVQINEFLATTREYAATKTRSGGLRRALELLALSQRHTQQDAPIAGLLYFFETLASLPEDADVPPLRDLGLAGLRRLGEHLPTVGGRPDGFPLAADADCVTYVPKPIRAFARERTAPPDLPVISIVVPHVDPTRDLGPVLASIADQAYPRAEAIVVQMQGSATSFRPPEAGELTIRSITVQGEAHRFAAIEAGLRAATGDVVTWVAPEHRLAAEALWVVADVFRTRPRVDVVPGNTLFTTLNGGGSEEPDSAKGEFVSRLPIGSSTERDYFFSLLAMQPPAAVYIRRSVLANAGPLTRYNGPVADLQFTLDIAHRVANGAVYPLERVLLLASAAELARQQAGSNRAELYRFSRRYWPSMRSPAFVPTVRNFVNAYFRYHYTKRRKTPARMIAATIVAAVVALRLGNPERWKLPTGQ